MEIVVADRILLRMHPELIGSPVAQTALHDTASHPEGESFVMMTAADLLLLVGLLEGSATKLGGPDNERFVEQTARL